MIWKHFVILGLSGGILRPVVDFPHKEPIIQSSDDFLVAGMGKLLNKTLDLPVIWDAMTPLWGNVIPTDTWRDDNVIIT